MSLLLAIFAQPGDAGRITRIRKSTERDAHGNLRATGEQRLVIEPASVQQVSTVETIGGRDAIASSLQAILPAGSDLLATDEVEWQGVRYLVDGDPFVRVGPVAALDHVEVTLQRKVG